MNDNSVGKLFIGGILPTTTQDKIHKYFEQFGELSDCVLLQDKVTGKPRGFGFVTYKDPKNVDEVLKSSHSIDGKELDCKRAIPRGDQHNDSSSYREDSSQKTKKLFVGGLSQTTTEDQFRDYFEKFGAIEDCVIMVDKETGKSRGFGFVTFASEDSVERVLQQYDNKIDGKRVECKKAQPRDPPSTNRRGGDMKHSGGRDQYSSRRDDGQRHERRDQGGYYQSNSGSGHGQKYSSRSQNSQNNYESYHSSEYGSNQYRNNYDSGYNQIGYNQQYGGGYQSNYPSSGYNASGYNYGQASGAYPSNYNASAYTNQYQSAYNPSSYGGYDPNYAQQYPSTGGYNPQGDLSGSAPTGTATQASLSNASMQNPVAGSNPTPTSTASTGGIPTQTAGTMGTGYGSQAGYGYGSESYGGDYGNAGMSNQGYASGGQSRGPNPIAGGGNVNKYGGAQQSQPQGSQQMNMMQQSGQSQIGPVKGFGKKQGIEERYYHPI